MKMVNEHPKSNNIPSWLQTPFLTRKRDEKPSVEISLKLQHTHCFKKNTSENNDVNLGHVNFVLASSLVL